MAVGIIFISRTPGYNEELMSYLFGNVLLVRGIDLWMMVGLDALVLAITTVYFVQLQAVCFDEEFARLRGLNVELYFLVLLTMAAITVVLLVSIVGIVLVIALLTLPVAIAGQLTSSLRPMMVASVLISIACTTTGLAVSYGPDLPAGATTIILAGGAYLVVLGLRRVLGR
jgi:zinc transport system permease protein